MNSEKKKLKEVVAQHPLTTKAILSSQQVWMTLTEKVKEGMKVVKDRPIVRHPSSCVVLCVL